MSTSSGPEWTGDMLDDPTMVDAFTTQLRRTLSTYAEHVGRVRRDAEAMWRANPPAGYGSFEAWWRQRWLVGPFREIQEHLEQAAALTFQVQARYRQGRHEIPARRRAAAEARHTPAITPSTGTGTPARPATSRLAEPRAPAPPAGDFMSMIRGDGKRSA